LRYLHSKDINKIKLNYTQFTINIINIVIITDEQFKDIVLHSLIILKHSIRNLNEKMDLLIEKSSKRTLEDSNIIDDDIIDYTNLYYLFPIEDVRTLNDIEEQLVSDKNYHKSLVSFFYTIVFIIVIFKIYFCFKQID